MPVDAEEDSGVRHADNDAADPQGMETDMESKCCACVGRSGEGPPVQQSATYAGTPD